MKYQDIIKNFKYDYGVYTLDDHSVAYEDLVKLLYPPVEWFFERYEGEYQGDFYMLGKDKGGNWYFFQRGYGSCSGCDALEAANNEGDMVELLEKMEGEVKVFPTKAAMLEYARKFDWYDSYYRDEEHERIEVAAIKAIEQQPELGLDGKE